MLLIFVSFLLAFTQNAFETECFTITPRNVKVDQLANHQNNSLYVQDIMRLSKAAEMQNYMNESTDPCSDFYTFSCGNWAKINPANSIERITTGVFQVLSKALNRKVERMLKAGVKLTDNEIDKKVKSFFESCTKIDSLISSIGYRQQLLDIIAEFGEMPVLNGNDWNDTNFDWLETVSKIAHKYGKGIIISLDVMPDLRMNTVNRLYIGHPNLLLESKSMYLDEVNHVYREAYRDKIATELHQHLAVNKALARQTANEIVQFEVSLSRGMVDEKLGLSIVDLMVMTTVAAMTQKYAPTLNIEKLVNITMSEAVLDPIYEFEESYQRNLVEVIEKTSKTIVANYIMYTLLNDFLMDSAKKQSEREKICIQHTRKYFAKNLDNMIYRLYNSNITESNVDFIWHELKQTFEEELQSQKLNWITPKTRQLAVDKLDAMKLEINSYAKDNFMEEYGELEIHKDDYIGNIKNILELSSRQAIAKLHKKPKPLEAGELLSYTPANILPENVVKVPVSLLQQNYLWAANYPNALKFGTIGALLGHELTHGFDDSGRKFDKNGNHNDWWDVDSSAAFQNHTDCFVDQYSRFSYGGRLLPKSASQSENIADNAGVRIAYNSYLRWLQKAKNTNADLHLETLPRMGYTNKQLFFISYAQVWCNDAHPKVRNYQTSTDTHVPGMFRVIGPLSNFPEFAKEFKCGRETPMNPVKRCEMY